MDTLIETPEPTLTPPPPRIDLGACGDQEDTNGHDPTSSSSSSRPNNAPLRFAMLLPPTELDLRSLSPTPQEFSPYHPSPLSAVKEDSTPPPPPPLKSPRSPSGPFPFPTTHRRKTSTASHTQYSRASVASTLSSTSSAGAGPSSSAMPPSVPSRSPLRRPTAKSTASFTGILKEFDLAPNSPLPRSDFPTLITDVGGPDVNGPQGRLPVPPNRPLPRRPSNASLNADFADTMLNPNPSLTSFAPTLTPEIVQASATTVVNSSTPPGPSTSKRKHALMELLSSEQAYAADLVLVKDIHVPLSRGLPPAFEPASNVHQNGGDRFLSNPTSSPHSSSPRSSTHTTSSAHTSSSVSTAPSSVNPADLPMTPEASKIIFQNIDEIAIFADRFADRLEIALGGVLTDGEGEDSVGELFLEMIPVMSPIYKAYITRHPTALAQFQALPPSSALTQYLAQTRTLTMSHTNAWDIPSLLIKPVQRLLKYPLLLSAIYNDTPDSHGDKAKLLEAKERVQEVARMVNEGRRRWEVVKAVLNQGKVNSSVNGAALVASSSRGGPPKVSRMRSFRAKVRSATSDAGDLDRGRLELELWERRIRECERVVKDVAKQTLEWNHEVDNALKALKGWNEQFGVVVGLESAGVEAVGAFGKVVAGLQLVSSDFHTLVETKFLPRLSALLRTVISPRTLLAHMHTLRHSHVTLLNTPYNKARPPSALIEASNDYLALQATLRDELPQYIALFEKGLGTLILELAKWQKNFWREIKERWVAFWMALAEEGEGEESSIVSGVEETKKVWWERFEEVEGILSGFNVLKRRPKGRPSTVQSQAAVYRQTNGSTFSMQDPLKPVYPHGNRAQSASDLLSNPTNPMESRSWDTVQGDLEHRSSNSTPSIHSRHKRSGSNADTYARPEQQQSRSELVQLMASSAIPLPGPPIITSPKREKPRRSQSRDEHEAKPTRRNPPQYRDDRTQSEPFPTPRLVEPFVQDRGLGGAVAPPSPALAPVPSSPLSPVSPRGDKKKGKDKDRHRGKDDDGPSVRATSPKPFRRRLTDTLFGHPRTPPTTSRSSSHARTKSTNSQFDLEPRSPEHSQPPSRGESKDGPRTSKAPSFAPLPALTITSDSFAATAPAPFQLHPPPTPLYTCTTIVPFLPLTSAKYMTLPMLELHVGDTVQVLYEAGHPSEHALPVYVDEGDDCLLIARDEYDRIGWVLASFLVPLA